MPNTLDAEHTRKPQAGNCVFRIFRVLIFPNDRVKNNQTVTLRFHHAKRKVRGKLKRQCVCGRYIPEEQFDEHPADCSGKAFLLRPKRKKWDYRRRKRKQPQAPSPASKALRKLLGS